MATGKRQGGPRPRLSISKKDAKPRVLEMFEGGSDPVQTTEATNDPPGLVVETVVPVSDTADIGNDGELSVRNISDRIEALFSALGSEAFPDTVYPPGSRNNGPQAREFVVADQLKKLADKRFKLAQQEADSHGVFGVPDQYKEGSTVEVYRSPSFTISVKVGAGSEMVDKEYVEQVLREVAPNKWQDLLKRCKKPRAGAVQKVVALK